MSVDEASSFEKALQTQEIPVPLRPEPPALFTQPLNKKEPCKLPTTQEQQERANFKAYWDGQCKNGYAFGLGRDIAISDTHHLEEITIYRDNGDPRDSPAVLYDFVNNFVQYRGGFATFPKVVTFDEIVSTNSNGFDIRYRFTAMDEAGRLNGVEFSPFSPSRLYLRNERNVIFRFVDNKAVAYLEPNQVKFSAEILDPKTQKAGGVVVLVGGNGQVRHLKLSERGAEPVSLAPEYLKHLDDKLAAAKDSEQQVNQGLEAARRMEREYLYMACNGKYKIEGLDKDVSTKICSWRDQFKPAFDKATEKAKQAIEERRKKAEVANLAAQRQQQIVREDERMQQQELQRLAAGFAQFGQQMNQSGQQMLQNTMNQPTPQVWAPPSNNTIRCVNSGVVTNCKY